MNATSDTPKISGYARTHNAYNAALEGLEVDPWSSGEIQRQLSGNQKTDFFSLLKEQQALIERHQTMPTVTRRIVQIFIADPNENVPLDNSILYKSDEKLTDLTDTELYFECPISERLTEHNKKRVTWPDKEASKRSGKDILLDPVKIRDLRMVIVTVAQF